MRNSLQVILSLALLVTYVWAAVRIFQKAGYTGWVVVLLLIPGVNLLTILWFAAAEWPLQTELRRLRSGVTEPKPHKHSREIEASALYHEAIGLEVTGRTMESLAIFQRILDEFPNTAAAQDARKNVDSLRRRASHG